MRGFSRRIKTDAMSKAMWMRLFARWHIWLGWLVGFPILMWTVTGLVMVAQPIEEVRGTNLRYVEEPRPIPATAELIAHLPAGSEAVEITQRMEGDELVAIITAADGSKSRYLLTANATQSPVDEGFARRVVSEQIAGGDMVESVTLVSGDNPPLDWRAPIDAWQVKLADGTNVYVRADTGEIGAVRTRFWRVFDFMWGLHIMDLEEREDTHHPILVTFAALSVLGALLGCVLMFRRRKARPRA